MRSNRGGDASFLIGLMFGIFVGAAVAVFLADMTRESGPGLDGNVQKAKESLESKAGEAKNRVEGAAEGAAPE